ncbi:MAG TPA: DUF72 domain-containing protein [Candidatus Acidoferrales bacterium]|nr:DUF72 domain-containing protein [Candidatus Acidoferrales bacterium]
MRAEIRIGTSGWQYGHWRGPFYPEKCSAAKMLNHYIQHFDSVEVNNTFYKLPRAEALRAWAAAVPKDFCFAVKASRFITHNKKLIDPQNFLDKFLPVVEVLGGKLGPILFQLPPKWRANAQRLEGFLAALPRSHRYTFEFRETSWNSAQVLQILRRYNAAYCVYELAGYLSPIEITADWAYVRLHGPGNKYQGSYERRTLRQWAAQIANWSTQLKAVYFYFDNDDAGYAARNALELKKLVERSIALSRNKAA